MKQKKKKKNRGKDFENQIRKSLEEYKCAWLRLKDAPRGYKGVCNPCDFVAYDYPLYFMLECKAHYGNTLPFSAIRQNQWDELLKHANIKGVVAGYLIWFIDHDVTVFVEARDLAEYRYGGEKERKSINFNDIIDFTLNHLYVYGEKKKILFNYKIGRLFEYVYDYRKECTK